VGQDTTVEILPIEKADLLPYKCPAGRSPLLPIALASLVVVSPRGWTKSDQPERRFW